MKVLFISNHEVTLYYFRCELISRLISEGNEVYISQPFGKYKGYFEALGCTCIDTPITQYGMNPVKEISLVGEYKKIIRRVRPDAVLTFTIKPNLYGGIAAAACKVPYISAVTGLGGAFEKGALFRTMTVLLYRYAMRRVKFLFFENKSNSDVFKKYNIAPDKHRIVNGSGVNLEKHSFCDYPEDKGETRFLFVGRVMNDKGVRELFSAFEEIKKTNEDAVLDVVGWCEDECKELLEDAVNKGIVNYHGWQEDIRPFYRNCHAVILPSYHEGMANVLLEAQATGRPVLASRIPGCIETFEEGVTGWGFTVKSTDGLILSIKSFLAMKYEDRQQSAVASRARIAELFNREDVVDRYVKAVNKSQEQEA